MLPSPTKAEKAAAEAAAAQASEPAAEAPVQTELSFTEETPAAAEPNDTQAAAPAAEPAPAEAAAVPAAEQTAAPRVFVHNTADNDTEKKTDASFSEFFGNNGGARTFKPRSQREKELAAEQARLNPPTPAPLPPMPPITTRAAPPRATWRTISPPIVPPAPVTSTVFPRSISSTAAPTRLRSLRRSSCFSSWRACM